MTPGTTPTGALTLPARTTGVINNISCKYEYITQPPSLAFGLGLDQWENM